LSQAFQLFSLDIALMKGDLFGAGGHLQSLAMKFIVDCVTARKITADVAVQFLQVQFIVERVVINVGMDRPATLAMATIACFVIARSAATQ